jgi:glycosyltransferase involved in cell wall biosynthesis
MSIQRIAILTHDLDGGAFTNLGTALAQGFQEIGIHCDLVILNPTDTVMARYAHLNVVSLNCDRTSGSLGAVVRYLHKHKPDVMLPMPWYFNIVAIWAKYLARVPTQIIIGEHNIISLEASIEYRNQLRLRFLPILMRWTYPHGQGLIGVCRDTLTDLHKTLKIKTHIPETVIHNPLNVEKVKQLSHRPIHHPWFSDHAGDKVPVILTTARLAKQKNLDNLIRAFAQVKEHLKARLLILGEGPLRPDLEHLCRELQVESLVSMPGYVDNPYPFMAHCGVFVLASAWEGCPVALEEAMACGAAIVVTDAPGGAKDVVRDGECGIVVPDGDLEALVEALVKVLTVTDFRKTLQQGAGDRAWDFHYLHIAQQYLDFANAVVSQKWTNQAGGSDR